MKSLPVLFAILPLAALTLLAPASLAQDAGPVEARFKVYGNCGMCKKRIEKAASLSGVTSAKWDKKSKMLSVTYLPGSVTADSLQRALAAAGHDTDSFKAPDSVYAELPACCLYRGSAKTH